MRIALDYDGTFTEDPGLWLHFIACARRAGHKVFIVTMRYEAEGADLLQAFFPKGDLLVNGIIFTGRQAKHAHLRERGIEPMDVWIDDNPYWVHNDASDRRAA